MAATMPATPKPSQRDSRVVQTQRADDARSTSAIEVPSNVPIGMKTLMEELASAGQALPETMRLAVEERAAIWNGSFKPVNAWEMWVLETTSLASLRLEACERSRVTRVCNQAQRASRREIWEVDQAEAVAETVAKFSKDPVRMIAKLRRSAQGVRRLLADWAELRAILDDLGTWDENARRLAFRLQGRPSELWSSDPMCQGRTNLDQNRTLVDRYTADLNRLLETGLIDQDELDRLGAVTGAAFDHSSEADQLRRCASQIERSLKWAVRQFKNGRHDFDPTIKPPPPSPFLPPSDPDSDSESDSNEGGYDTNNDASSEPINRIEPAAMPIPEPAPPVEKKVEGFLSRAARKVFETTRALSVSASPPTAPPSSPSLKVKGKESEARRLRREYDELQRIRKESRSHIRRKRAKGTLAAA